MLFVRLRLGLLGAVCCFVSAAPVRIGCALGAFCRCRLLWALLVCFHSVLLVRARGPALHPGVCLLGFPAVVCAATPIPTVASLCNIGINRASDSRTVTRQYSTANKWWNTMQSTTSPPYNRTGTFMLGMLFFSGTRLLNRDSSSLPDGKNWVSITLTNSSRFHVVRTSSPAPA